MTFNYMTIGILGQTPSLRNTHQQKQIYLFDSEGCSGTLTRLNNQYNHFFNHTSVWIPKSTKVHLDKVTYELDR